MVCFVFGFGIDFEFWIFSLGFDLDLVLSLYTDLGFCLVLW